MTILDFIFKSYLSLYSDKSEFNAGKVAMATSIPLCLNVHMFLFILMSPMAGVRDIGGVVFLIATVLFVFSIGIGLRHRYVTREKYKTFSFKKNTGWYQFAAICHFAFSLIGFGITFHNLW